MGCKMQLKHIVSVLFIFLNFFYCSNKGNNDEEFIEEYNLSDVFKITEIERLKLEEKALLGSPDAAFKVFQHYDGYEGNASESLFWVQIAAENGNVHGQYTYGYILSYDILSQKPDYTQQEIMRRLKRAQFWLEKAEKGGIAEATGILHEIEDYSAKTEK